MNARLALYALIAQYGLSSEGGARLSDLAGLQDAPADVPRRVAHGMAMVAAGLAGFGVVLWVAANWDILGRAGRFALLQGIVVVATLLAWKRPAWRVPLSLAIWFGTGSLFAFFGQTYQTGADPWQLFAVWSAVTLPLCLWARSDWIWSPWTVAVITAITLWVHAHVLYIWGVDVTERSVHLASWAMTVGLCTLLHVRFQRWTGAGVWSWRLAVVFAVTTLTFTALVDLVANEAGIFYPLGLLLAVLATAGFAHKRWFDLFALSLSALAMDALIVHGTGYFLLKHVDESWLLAMFLLGLFALGLLSGTVSLILRRKNSSANVPGDAP